MSKKRKIVSVLWEDSASPELMTWRAQATDKPGTILCTSIGYLGKPRKGLLTITPHVTDQDHICGVMSIPATSVRKIKRLK